MQHGEASLPLIGALGGSYSSAVPAATVVSMPHSF